MMRPSVLIIGGGPAGLTTALRLSARGYAVTLLEQGGELGGRLIRSGADAIPPVFLGCHRASLSLLKTLGTARHVRFSKGINLEFLLRGDRTDRLHRPWVPAPFHALLSLATFRGLPFQDRWRALMLLERTWEGDPALPPDLESRTADEWLADRGQSEAARALVWSPLARFLLGDELTVVSAAMLITMLARCFLSARRNSGIAIPAHGMRHLLLEPARAQLLRSGATIRLGTAVNQIRFDAQRVSGVDLQTGGTLAAESYVAALPHQNLYRLLPEGALARYSYFQQLTGLTDSPALTVHLWLDRPLPGPRLLLLPGKTYHWMVSRPDDGPTLVSLVATGNMDVLDRPDRELLEVALHEVRAAFPALSAARTQEYRIVREPHAFLSVKPGTTALRPLQQSPFLNLCLAGDWTDTGLPATLESAILSGERCADAIHMKMEEHR